MTLGQQDGSSTDESLWTEVQQTKVGRKSDKSWTDVERVEFSRRCGDGGRRRYTAAPRNAATMAENAIARNVVAALAGNALQLAAFLRRYYDNVTRRCCGNALDLAAVLRWLTTHWTS